MKIPIITYHALGESSSPLWLSTKTFENHLKFFADNGFKTISLSQLTAHVNRSELPPEKVFAITFDDGYESVYSEALPRLKDYGFDANVYIVSDYCNRNNQWPTQPDFVPTSPLLSWKQIEELSFHGFEIGAHTKTHPVLTSLSPAQIHDEIVLSKQALEHFTGQRIKHFAYPYGAINEEVTEVVQSHFETAVSTKLGLVKPSDDPYLFNRIDAYYLSSFWISHMHGALHESYLSLRQIIRDVRNFGMF